MNLHTAGHRRGVVAAPHAAAVEDGRAILAEGGNAIEAMIAMAASIAAVYPHMNHVGGDGFWLIREPSGRVRAIMGAGRAGSRATLQLYRDAGHHEIPARGPLAALTVPGAVAGWMLAAEAAKANGGKLPLDLLLTGAIKHAREGYTVTRSQARLTAEKLPEMKDAVGFRQAFLIDGKAPEAGAKLKQTAFAATLDQLAQAGLEDFYRGDVGREIAADLERIGSPVTRADLEKYEAKIAEPLSVPIGAGTLYNTPPPTQGLASLMILALFDRLRVGQAESFEHIHGLVEATKRAFRVRDRFVTDPDQIDGNLNHFLSPKFLDVEAEKIDRKRAARWPAPYGEGDTVWMGAADASGLVVSYIQSLYWEFGSGCVLPATGILMQNRGVELLARSQGAQRAGARSPPIPHAQPGAGDHDRWSCYGLWHHGRRRPAANSGRRVHPPRHIPPAARARARRATLAARAHLGFIAHQPAAGIPLRRQSDRPTDVGRS